MGPVWEGIVVGSTGGAFAGVALWLVQQGHSKCSELMERRRIVEWLRANTKDRGGEQTPSTQEIASWTNLSIERVRYLCSIDPKVFMVVGSTHDQWSIYAREPKSVYDERGVESF